jgi:heat shock protein HtpX
MPVSSPSPSPSPSLAARTVAAVSLMIGFYVLALGIAAALIAAPVAEYFYADRVDARLAIFGFLGAVAILRAIVPRRDRFEAPGPTLTADEHPQLFATLNDIARSTDQAMPTKVYLIPEVNAWVAQRGGVMGFGSHRVMGLGLPLMAMLTVDELRAVLAHEFGHYHGGDTALGPWIYRTRAAIGRTLHHMSRHSRWLVKPFEWYGAAFLRITHAISRRQEYAADALAARTVGAGPLVTGLLAIEGAAGAIAPYWAQELGPVLDRGFRPPIAVGFTSFLSSADISSQVDALVANVLKRDRAEVYDTHPALSERLAALGIQLDPKARRNDEPRAITLLGDLDAVEARFVEFLSDGKLKSASPIAWDDVGDKVWSAIWRDHVKAGRAKLIGITPAKVPALALDLAETAVQFGLAPNRDVARKSGADVEVVHLLGSACAVVLLDHGWSLSALPGETVILSLGDARIAPFASIPALSTGPAAMDEWQASWRAAGLQDVELAPAS